MNKLYTMDDLKNELLKNPEFREEYYSHQAEYQVLSFLIDARNAQHITQKELSKLSGIDQADISKIERGVRNISLNTLKRLADAMDMYVKIEFIPKENTSKNSDYIAIFNTYFLNNRMIPRIALT